MFQATVLVVLINATCAAGPLDAFRANYASIKADLRYRHEMGPARSTVVGNAWHLKRPEFHPELGYGEATKLGNERRAIAGRWACDGAVEYYDYAMPDDALARFAEKKWKPPVSPTEALYGEDVFLGHHYRHQPSTPFLLLWNYRTADFLNVGAGPFLWWNSPPFPQFLDDYIHTGSEPRRRMSVRDGHPVEVEVYERHVPEHPDVREQLEAAYDPAVGYLPRYMKVISYNDKLKSSISWEFYLINARRCSAGGFVPTEWYATYYEAVYGQGHFPQSDDETPIEPAEDQVCLMHFLVTDFQDLSRPIALTRLEGVKGVLVHGQAVKFAPGTRSLTMAQFKALAGKHLDNPPAVPGLAKLGADGAQGAGGPALDRAEMNEYSDAAQAPWPWHLGVPGVLGVVVIVAGAALILRRRFAGRVLPLLLLCGALGGCTRYAGPPVIKLSTRFQPNPVVYDIKSDFPTLQLVVGNAGNRALELRRADGGCSCRQLDQSRLPARLGPGETFTIDARFAAGPRPDLQQFQLAFDTDRGPLRTTAMLLALPTHQLSPSSLSVTLQEGRDTAWQFELVHRAIFRGDGPSPDVMLDVPPEFVATMIGRHAEPVNRAPELHFQDTNYRITLREKRFGLHRAPIALRGANRRALVEAPVTWQCLPFLAATPDRVSLGVHPVRVFLRCPDEKVELTRVVARPVGVKAVVSSTRELTVMLDEDAPDVIDGQIEVSTTATDRPPMTIPVVRYAPSGRTAAINP